jgi:hypothetical protein
MIIFRMQFLMESRLQDMMFYSLGEFKLQFCLQSFMQEHGTILACRDLNFFSLTFPRYVEIVSWRDLSHQFVGFVTIFNGLNCLPALIHFHVFLTSYFDNAKRWFWFAKSDSALCIHVDWLQHQQCSTVHLRKTRKFIAQLMDP